MQKTLIEETKRKEKHNKGITLIALVVTIIILLILAGVSIITLTGENGIITRTSGAKTAIENASIREQVQLAVMAGMSNRDLRVEQEMLEDALTKSFGAKGTGYTIEGNSTDGWTVTVGTQSYKITSTGEMEEVQPPVEISTLVDGSKVAKTTAVKDKSTKPQTFYIPQDFKLATGSPTKVDEGIVVEDERGNQFVWVPVPVTIWDSTKHTEDELGYEQGKKNYTPMAVADSTCPTPTVSGTLYRGLLYTFSGTTATYKSSYTVGKTSYREPSLVTGASNVKWAPMSIEQGQTDVAGSSYDRANFENAGSFATASAFGAQMQIDYNEMITSVNTYGGFYVGRFETGYETVDNAKVVTSKPAINGVTTLDASMKVKVGETTVINNTWYGLYKAQKEFSTSEKVKSSMIWGSQYDAMMNWMAKTGKTVGTADSSKCNTATTTGSNAEDVLNNVFDLYGCHYEWTLEAHSTYNRAKRGGIYYNNYAPAIRDYNAPISIIDYYGSRLALYIVE